MSVYTGRGLEFEAITRPNRYMKTYRKGRQVPKHVAIIEDGRAFPLPLRAEVHHVNGNRRDNRRSNLVVCQDHAFHMLLHRRQRVLAAGGNPSTDEVCSECGYVGPVSGFSKKRPRNCLPCHRAKANRWYYERKERASAA